MSRHRDFFEDLEAKTPEERALADKYEQLTRAVVYLTRLREERGVTQKVLASALEVTQPTVSKLERSDDMLVTTLDRYVGALGGSLRLTAVFDDQEVELGVIKQTADCGMLKGSSGTRKGGRTVTHA